MASTVVPMKEICKKAVAARDYDRAESFAKEYGFEVFGFYDIIDENKENKEELEVTVLTGDRDSFQ